MPIRAHLPESAAFEPAAITAMSQAFEQACAALHIYAGDLNGRETIATRIIDLARSGVIDARCAAGSRVGGVTVDCVIERPDHTSFGCTFAE